VETGLCGAVVHTVTDDDTAIAAHSGDVPVLSTPRIVALCEEASVNAVADALAKGETTVGMRVQLNHLAPVGVGGVVTVAAKLERIEGRRLLFTVSVNDARGLVAAGKVTRVVVERERFLEKVH
jgi:predicted thioesterase